MFWPAVARAQDGGVETSSTSTITDAGVPEDAAVVIRRVIQVAVDAGPTDGEAPDAGTVSREVFIATYQGLDSPIEFEVSYRGQGPSARAKEATEALTAALERRLPEDPDPLATVDIAAERAIVRVRGLVVTTLHPEDAAAKGYSLEQYAEQLEAKLQKYVPTQLRRNTLQGFVLHLFISVFLIVIAVLTLRFLRRAFDRWDDSIEQRPAITPPSIFRIPILSSEAVGGLLAFGLSVGRFVAYIVTVAATAAAIFSQFDATRPILSRIASSSGAPFVNATRAFLGAIPGILLAAALVLALHAGLRVVNTLLDGVAHQRLTWRRLTPPRVPALRGLITWSASLILAPLIVAAAFGSFGTPLEKLALATGGAVLLAAVPALASAIYGALVLWREVLHGGEWVEIGPVRGEVTQVNLQEIHLVPEGGGTIIVPMLYLLFHPLQRLREPPLWTLRIAIARDRPAKELLEKLEQLTKSAADNLEVEAIDLGPNTLYVQIQSPVLKPGLRHRVLLAISEAADRGEIRLAEQPTPRE